MKKLKLQSPKWSLLKHAYGDASNVPQLIERLRSAKDAKEWDAVRDELMVSILHQGDVYSATYAAMPHLLELAIALGPCEQSDSLVDSFGWAARGGPGSEAPEFLEESWEDAQDAARDLMLERLINREASSEYAGAFITHILLLSGEFSWARLISDWVSCQHINTNCSHCGNVKEIFWLDGPKQTVRDGIDVTPSTEAPIAPEPSMEFDEELLTGQILGLAQACGYPLVEAQVRSLLGTIVCSECGKDVPLDSAMSREVND